MAVQSELDLSRERKQVDDLTAAFERLQLGAAKTNRTNLSALESQVDALASSASGSLKRMLTGLKGNLQELDGMLTATGRQVGVAWKSVAADTLARVNADMSKVKQVFQSKFEEATRVAVAASAKMAADIKAAEQKALSAGSGGAGQGLQALARTRAEGYTDAFGTYISASSAKMAADIKAAERRMLSAGETGVASAATARQRVAGSTNALGLFVPTIPGISAQVTSSIKPADIKNVNDLSTAFRKLSVDGNDVHSAMRGLASGFNLLWLTWGNLAPLFAGASLSFGVTKTFEIGSEVEHNIKMLEVLGDKTKEQGSVIREELRKIDQTTLFSLKELSKTMVDLEQAGISGAEGLRLLKVGADLAAVGNTNLDVTSKLLTQTMGVFPETAADIEKAAAQMFKTTKDGKLNIDNIGDSIRYASTANLMYGQSLEDTLVALKALASVGITDTMAGTGFANLLQDLTGRTGPAKKALAEMEKALGRTIKAFDTEGKARPFLDVVKDIQEALGKFKPAAAMELANKAFTERGLRPLFAAIAQGTVDLKDYKKELQNIDPSILGKSASAVMDTTKGAMDKLRGELVGLLDRTFESMDSRFKDSINRLTGLIGSSEFSAIMRGMVSGVVALGEAAVQYLPTILKLGTAFVAFKAMNMLQPMLMGVASAMAGLISFLTLGSTQMGRLAGSAVASATSVGALGASMIVTAASSRAAAAGLGIVQVEAAGAAAKLTVAAGAGRAAAVVLGFLANPIVGTIATLGLLAYTFSSVSKSSQTASEELSSKIYKDGKVNIDILNQEIAKINELNVVKASGAKQTVFDTSIEDAKSKYQGAADNYKKVQVDIAKASEKDISDVAKAGLQSRLIAAKDAKERTYDNWHALHFARQKVLDNSEKLEKEAEAKRMKGVKAAQAASEEAARRAASGLDLAGGSTAGRFAKEHTTAIKQVKDNLDAIASSSQAAVAQLTDTYNTERDVLKNRHSNQLVDEGTYQAQSLAQLQTYEAEKLRLLDAKDEAGRAEAYRVYVANSEILQKQLAQAKGTADEQLTYRTEKEKEFSEEVNRVGEKLRSDLANSETERVKLHNEAFKRMTLAAQDYEGVVKKLDLQTDDEILAIRLKREEADATANLARQYDGVTTSSMAYLQAQKAAALASAAAQAEAQKHLETVDKAIKLAEQAAESYARFIDEMSIPLTDEVLAAFNGMGSEIEALRRNRAKYAAEATTDIAAAGKRAFDNIIAEDLQRLKSGTSDAIMTGLFEGGQAGKDSLRKLIVDELKKPVRLFVDAIINPVVGALMGSLGISTAASAAGTGLASSLGGSALGTAIFGTGGATAFASNIGAGISSTLSGWVGGGAPVSAIGAGSGVFTAGQAIPYIGAALLALNALGVFRSKKIVGGGLSGTLGEGDINSYDLQRKGGTLFSGPSYSIVNQKKSAWSEMIQADWARVSKATVDMATALDLSTDAAKGFTATLGTDVIHPDTGGMGINLDDLTGKGLTDEQYATEVQKRINAALAAGSEELAQKLIGSWTTTTETVKKAVTESTGFWEDYSNTIAYVDEVVTTSTYTVSEFARSNETALETLTRLSGSLVAVNAAAEKLGFNSKLSGLAAANAASNFTDLFGTLDDFNNTVNNYFENYYTEAEQLTYWQGQVAKGFSQLGIAMPDTRAGLRAMIESAEKLGDPLLVANLLKLTGPLDAYLDMVDNAASKAEEDARKASEAASNAASSAEDPMQAIREKYTSAMTALAEENQSLNIEMLRSVGDEEAALSAERAAYIRQYSQMAEAEQQLMLARYDENQALKAQIAEIGKQKEALSTFVASMQSNLANMFNSADAYAINAYNIVAKLANDTEVDNVGQLFSELVGANAQQIREAAVAFVQLEGSSLQAKAAVLEAASSLITMREAAEEALTSANEKLISAWKAIAAKTVAAEDAIISGLISAQDELASLASSGADSLRQLSTSIRDFVSDIDSSDLSGGNELAQLAAAKEKFSQLATAALGGDTEAQGKLTGAASKVLELGKATAASSVDYLRLVAQTKQSLLAVSSSATTEADRLSPVTEGLSKVELATAEVAKWTELASKAGISAERIAQAQWTSFEKAKEEWVKAKDLQTQADRIVLRLGVSNTIVADAMATMRDGSLEAKDAIKELEDATILVRDALSVLNLSEKTVSGLVSAADKTVAGLPEQLIKGLTPLEKAITALTEAIGSLGVKTSTGTAPSAGTAAVIDKYGYSGYSSAINTIKEVAAIEDPAAFAAGANLVLQAAQGAGVSSTELAVVMADAGYPISASDLSAYAQAQGLPAFRAGINNVPYDMTARIHRGEAVVPEQFNPFNPNAESAWNNDEVVAMLKEIKAELVTARVNNTAENTAIAINTQRTAKILKLATGEDNAIITTAQEQV